MNEERPTAQQRTHSGVRHRSSAKWLVLAALVAVAVIAGAAIFAMVSSGGGSVGEGPLAGSSSLIGFGMPVDVGTPASISGPYVVQNVSDRPLVLDRLDLVGREQGLTLVGAYVVRASDIGGVLGYRVPRDGHAVRGATVPPHTRIAIVLGLKVAAPGSYAFHSFTVSYHQGSHDYRNGYPVAARFCARARSG